jgi:hypothetical protein
MRVALDHPERRPPTDRLNRSQGHAVRNHHRGMPEDVMGDAGELQPAKRSREGHASGFLRRASLAGQATSHPADLLPVNFTVKPPRPIDAFVYQRDRSIAHTFRTQGLERSGQSLVRPQV